MIADRLLGALARVGYAPTKWSVVRIPVFALAGLLLATLVLPARPGDLSADPYNVAIPSRHARNVSLPIGDARGFQPTSPKRAYRVAWIGGSEMLGVDPQHRKFIPGMVGKRVGPVDGKPVSTDIYFLNAIRLTDELAAVQTAVESKPDLVVVSLNPVWALNDVAAQQWGYLDGGLARHSLWPPSSWPVAASLVSPGDLGWRVLSGLSRPVADRYDWGVDLLDKTSGLTVLDEVADPPIEEPSGLAKLAATRPVDFFFNQALPFDPSADLAETQTRILEREAMSTSSFNRQVLRQILATIRRAHVDAYLYMPPISPEIFAQPRARQALRWVRKELASATAGQTTDRVLLDPKGLQARVPEMWFKDIVHVYHPGPEADVIAKDICGLLVSRGKQPRCEER